MDERALNPFYTLIIAVKIRTFKKVKFVRVFLQNCVYFFRCNTRNRSLNYLMNQLQQIIVYVFIAISASYESRNKGFFKNRSFSRSFYKQSYRLLTGDPAAQSFTLSQGKALAMTAIDVFTNSELLQRIKDDFAKDLQTRK